MTLFHNRRACQIENAQTRVTVLAEGGHIAEILHQASGVNPLWIPPWPSIEPSSYDPQKHPEYGGGAESRLLAGIMGHNLCLDIFGGVSSEEAAAGFGVHGEAPVAPFEIEAGGDRLSARAVLPQSQLRFERVIRLEGERVLIRESVENLAITDRPIGWTQHVTLGPPFIERGKTQFRASATKSKVFEGDFAGDKEYMKTAAEFDWPYVPTNDGKTEDMRVFTSRPVSGAFSTHLVDPARQDAYFLAWSPASKVLFGYEWKQADFPWLGIWEENCCRTGPPWNGKTITRGMEFGVSPMPETRRQMIERGSLFGVPGFRWIPARTTVVAEYHAFIRTADAIPGA